MSVRASCAQQAKEPTQGFAWVCGHHGHHALEAHTGFSTSVRAPCTYQELLSLTESRAGCTSRAGLKSSRATNEVIEQGTHLTWHMSLEEAKKDHGLGLPDRGSKKRGWWKDGSSKPPSPLVFLVNLCLPVLEAGSPLALLILSESARMKYAQTLRGARQVLSEHAGQHCSMPLHVPRRSLWRHTCAKGSCRHAHQEMFSS